MLFVIASSLCLPFFVSEAIAGAVTLDVLELRLPEAVGDNGCA
jgi:hypothetical protein